MVGLEDAVGVMVEVFVNVRVFVLVGVKVEVAVGLAPQEKEGSSKIKRAKALKVGWSR